MATGMLPIILVVTSAKFVTLEIGSHIAMTSLVLNDDPSLIEINHLAEFPSVSGNASTGDATVISVATRDVKYARSSEFSNVILFTVADDPDKYDDEIDDSLALFSA